MSHVRFDAYTATVKSHDPGPFLSLLASPGEHGVRCHGDEISMHRGYHGFDEKAALKDESGAEVLSVLWGGRNAGVVMVEAKGGRTTKAVDLIRSMAPEHNCTRVDSCYDVDEQGAWGKLLRITRKVKREHGLWGEVRGDPSFPELGLTQMLGAPSSAVRVRLYEKGKQPDLRHLNRPNLVRLEVQVRPQKAAKAVYSSLSPIEVWGATKFTRDLAARVLASSLQPAPAGTIHRQSSSDRAVSWMLQQYGCHLLAMLADHGDWACVGKELGHRLDLMHQRRLKPLGSGGE